MARILVIDDESGMRRLVSNILTAAGHEVAAADDGRKGVKLFAAERFEVVAIDIFMPDQDGIETIREIRATGARVKILALSGGGAFLDMSCLKYSRTLGADASLAKPFRPAELSAAVAALLSAD